MAYRKINPFLLGVCIAYVSLGICQLVNAHMFTSKLYMTVAIVSLNLSMVELLKALTKRLEDLANRNKAILRNYNSEKFGMKRRSKRRSHSFDRLNARIIKAGHITVYLGYAMSVFFMIRTPFKAIPDTERTNIVIGATSLFTFALLFISMIINEAADYDDQEYEALSNKLKRDQAILSHLESLKAQRQDDADTENAVEEK